MKGVLPLIFFALSLSGCEVISCSESRDAVHSDRLRSEIVAWADATVFSRRIEDREIGAGGFVGPGRRYLKLRAAQELEVFSDRQVRLIGDDVHSPDAVFFASGAFRGVVISRPDNLNEVIRHESIQPEDVLAKKGRAVAICRDRR